MSAHEIEAWCNNSLFINLIFVFLSRNMQKWAPKNQGYFPNHFKFLKTVFIDPIAKKTHVLFFPNPPPFGQIVHSRFEIFQLLRICGLTVLCFFCELLHSAVKWISKRKIVFRCILNIWMSETNLQNGIQLSSSIISNLFSKSTQLYSISTIVLSVNDWRLGMVT